MKMKVLFALLALSVIANLLQESWLFAGVGLFLAIGVWLGNDAIRSLLIGVAGVGAGGSIGQGILVAIALVAHAIPLPMGLTALLIHTVNASLTGFAFWSLRQPDTRRWLLERSIGTLPA
jgi:hypothetical protein